MASIYSIIGRVLLSLNGLVIGKTGVEYITGSFKSADGGRKQDFFPTFTTLFAPEVFEGPALPVLVPFMGVAYLTVTAVSLVAAFVADDLTAGLTVAAIGLTFHYGMAIIRLRMPPKLAASYNPGAVVSMSRQQFIAGTVLCGWSAVLLLFFA